MNNLSKATSRYMTLLAKMFEHRLTGEDETAICDEMDDVWKKLTIDERETMNAISKLLSTLED